MSSDVDQTKYSDCGYVVSTWNTTIKRGLDIMLSLVILLIVSPVLLLIWISIRFTSEGPVVFRQARVGKDGLEFIILKFRTMIHNAPDLRNPDNSTFNSDNDPRVTKVGGLLRRTSLDELPQLINVIRGEMSLVGPRPELPDGPKTYLPHQFARLKVRPGMTGWVAVNGRNNTSINKKRDMDAWYAENWTLSLDARILWRTVIVVLCRQGVNGEWDIPWAPSVAKKL
jgi:undecaprenyl phosphate N,N'-diacetylbacillosamine 1-phosphate transferase